MVAKPLKVTCDFDGVIADLLPDWCAHLRGIGYSSCWPSKISQYNLAKNECLAGVTSEQLMSTLALVDYSDTSPTKVPWMDGVVQELPLLTVDYNFTFVSCQPVDAERQMAAKNFRLQRIIPKAVVARHLTAQERISLPADVLIDDRLDIIEEFCRDNPTSVGILFNAPYNRTDMLPHNAVRVFTWDALAGVLNTLAPSESALVSGELYPEDAAARKAIPIYSGYIKYFPDAIEYINKILEGNVPAQPDFEVILARYAKAKNPKQLAYAWYHLTLMHPQGKDGLVRDVAATSYLGNEQHNPGQPLHWARGKSMDQLDASARHEAEFRHGKVKDKAGYSVLGQAGWRVLAELQINLESKAGT